MISTVKNFLTMEEIGVIEKTIEKLNKSNAWGNHDSGWSGRVINPFILRGQSSGYIADEQDSRCLELLINIRLRVREHILTSRSFSGQIYADTLQIVRWLPGNLQLPHADSQYESGEPHPFHWREQASIIYINSDYEGGEVYFPKHGLEIKPEPGMLATFPGTTEYMHGVRAVESGIRYTIASFWTTDPDKKDDTYQ